MSSKCDGCGLEAPLGVRLQRQPIPFCGAKMLCPKCHRKLEERFLLGALLINFLFGPLGLALLWQNSQSEAGHVLVNIFFLVIFATLAILPHELAHAAVARLAGLRVVEVWIGRGADVLTTRLFGFPLRFKIVPVGGFAFLQHWTQDRVRLRYFLAVLAGPLVNLLLAAAAYPFVDWHDWNFDRRLCPGHAVVITQLLVTLENLLPYRFQTAYGKVASDGLSLAQLLFSRSPDLLSRQLRIFSPGEGTEGATSRTSG